MRIRHSPLVPALLCLALAAALRAEDVSLSAEANRSQLYVGESFILQINIAGSADIEPDLSQIRNARIRPLGKQNISNISISFVNGKMTRQGFSGLVCSYEITPLAAGPFRAGPIRTETDKGRLEIEGPLLTVTDIEAQDWVLLAVVPSRETVLIDEPFDIALSLRIKLPKGLPAGIQPLFPNQPPALSVPWLTLDAAPGLQGPDIQRVMSELLIPNGQPGFRINEFTRRPDIFDFSSFMGGPPPAVFALDRRLVSLGGQDYFEYGLTLSYTARDEGNYVFGPVVFKGPIPVSAPDRGQAERRALFAVGAAATVRVVPPPEAGRPAGFTGALGSNLVAQARLDTNECLLGDPLILTLELSGPVRFDKMAPPKLSLQTNVTSLFTVYDNTVTTERGPDACRFVYTLRPHQAGAIQVPPIEVFFYDVASRGYAAAVTQPIPLRVRQGREVTAAELRGHTNLAAASAQAADDRRLDPAPIRTELAGAQPAPLLGGPSWLRLAAAGILVYLANGLLRFGMLLRRRYAPRRRHRRALPRALKKLALARRMSRADPSTAGHLLCDALRRYLAERLDAPSAGLTPDDARRLLAEAGVPAPLLDELISLFELHFEAGYSAQPAAGDLAADSRRIGALLQALDPALRTPPP